MKSISAFRWLRTFKAGASFLALTTIANIASVANGSDDPTAADALQLKPTQQDVSFDQPTATEAASCEIKTIDTDDERGWVVTNENGVVLRRFVDTNADNKLDRWCYFENGVEVFRDIDANFNGVADQHRWLGTAGMRWGLDGNEDGEIDSWRMISAEEVTSEIVAAVKTNDFARFARVLLTESELNQLGVGDSIQEEIESKMEKARDDFRSFVQTQRAIDESTRWLHFGGTRPNLIPSGTDGSTQDVVVYDNVAAIIETNGNHGQIAIGTLVRVGDKWRAIDLPEIAVEGQAATNGGMIYNASVTSIDDQAPSGDGVASAASQQLLEEYDEIDQQIARARTPAEMARLNERRADILIELSQVAVTAEEKMNWIRQISDTISGAFQTGEYPGGLAKLNAFERQLTTARADTNAIAYVRYRILNAKYTQDIQSEDADLSEIQQEWLENLASFVRTYRDSEHAPDAMMQLALAEEFAGQDERAIAWYEQVVANYPDTTYASKATGAKRRLNSVGQPLRVQGSTITGQRFDSSSQRGKVIIVHYWATWCDLCKEEFQVLKDMQAKYQRGVVLVGVNLDIRKESAEAELRNNPLPWPQLFEEGGLDGRLANEMGVVTLPTMIMINQQGRVVRRDVTAGELDAELRALLR